MKRLLLEAWTQAKEKLEAVYKAIMNGTYRIEGKRLYAPDGAWIYIGGATPHLKIHSVTGKARFPDLLKLPRERLELLQLGWRASDEGENGRPVMEHHTALAGVRLDRDEIRRALHTRRFGQPDA
jgi:hypothetical protein